MVNKPEKRERNQKTSRERKCVVGWGGVGNIGKWGTERRRGRDSLLIWSTVRDKVSPHMTLSDWLHISKRAHRIDTATSVNAICCSIHHPRWIMTGTHGTALSYIFVCSFYDDVEKQVLKILYKMYFIVKNNNYRILCILHISCNLI